MGAGVGVGVAVGLGVGIHRGVGIGVGNTDMIGVGVGVGVGFGDFDTAADAVGTADGGDSTTGFALGAGVLLDCSLGDADGERLAVPGSDQSLTFSPFANVACNRVLPCSLITGPSNFPRTILPV